MTNRIHSPLRYPGGKGSLANFLGDVIKLNDLQGGIYYELFAGGAGAALSLLYNKIVSKVVINDADYRVYAFWHSILQERIKFLRLLEKTDVSIDEWKLQKSIYENAENESMLKVGFATFFLNRTNRSGIIHKAGPIGGLNQNGNYLIDVRFNKDALRKRINDISKYSKSIEIFNFSTEAFLSNERLYKSRLANSFFYLDPPYYYKGQELYLNNYIHDQHQNLANLIQNCPVKYWLLSYDNVIEIRKMYSDYRKSKFSLNYSLNSKKQGSELMIFSDALKVPKTITIRSKTTDLTIR